MTIGVPKPVKVREQACTRCKKFFTARALLSHAPKCGKPNKYGAKKTIIDGQEFPSRLEARTWEWLLYQKRTGHIESAERYVTVHLTDALIAFKVDFRIRFSDGRIEFVEAKGAETERFRLLKKLWAHYSDFPLRIYKAERGGSPYLAETVWPVGGPRE